MKSSHDLHSLHCHFTALHSLVQHALPSGHSSRDMHCLTAELSCKYVQIPRGYIKAPELGQIQGSLFTFNHHQVQCSVTSHVTSHITSHVLQVTSHLI